MRFIMNSVLLFMSALLQGSLVMSLPQGTVDLSANANIVDLSQRLQAVLDAANAGDSMRVYTLSTSLLQYDIRMSSSDGTAVMTETDMLSSMKWVPLFSLHSHT
jgi:hypothetical protein